MEFNPEIFKDQKEAGKKLGRKLYELDLENPIVFAIPAGGVPVGKEVARFLDAPLDLIIVRKIKIPWNPEAGLGAVGPDGEVVLNSKIVPALGLSSEEIDRLAQETFEEIKHREEVLRPGKKKINTAGRIVVLVDDGLAAGYTMLAAVNFVKKQSRKKIIVAVPTASGSAVELIKPEVDRFICLYTHPKGLPFAVASSYKNWHDLSDKEVLCAIRPHDRHL